MSEQREVRSGNLRAVFQNDGEGWRPDWFYEGERPMLRFKDHEWLSLGHVHPTTAEQVQELENGGLAFRGRSRYGQTPVPWQVRIEPDPAGPGFLVTCAFTPERSIELLEAYSTFETPYEYDGQETVTTVIGMNPVIRWLGPERQSPPLWENPAWCYARPQIARLTAKCSAPYLCQAITAAADTPDRFITVAGDWETCRVQDVAATPTRVAPHDPTSLFANAAERKGFKYLVGALNWTSAYAKDPNVLFEGEREHRQRLALCFQSDLGDLTWDAYLLRGWDRVRAFSFPANARVAAYDRATARGIGWRQATDWLRSVFTSPRATEDLFDPAKGICTYARGSRPKAGGSFTWRWWPQWAGGFRYRAELAQDQQLAAACDRCDEHFLAHAHEADYFRERGIANKVSSLPGIWWAAGHGKGGKLWAGLQPMLEASCEFSEQENGKARKYDYGAQASLAEALLLGARAYDSERFAEQGLLLVNEFAKRLDDRFWEFNVGSTGSLTHGGQIRSLGHGHAIMANLLAWRRTHDEHYLADAHRFARYLLAVSYATHNGSLDPDFDWRGWCNGSNAGRDQIAEFPPWETQNGLLCLAALMAEKDLEPPFYDALWYIARTGLAQFPAARTMKRLLDQEMRVHYVPRGDIASEECFYQRWPYLAYENPHDQTLLASYQGTDCLLGEQVYGHGLAWSEDDRLGVFVPRAAWLDLREADERRVQIWNPLSRAIESTITVRWPDGELGAHAIVAPPRQILHVTFHHESDDVEL